MSNSFSNPSNSSLIYFIVFLLLVIIVVLIVIWLNQRNRHRYWGGWGRDKVIVVSSCGTSKYGCCPDGKTPRINPQGSNC